MAARVREASTGSLDVSSLQPVVFDSGDSEFLSGGGHIVSVGVALAGILDAGQLASDSSSIIGSAVGPSGSTSGALFIENLLNGASGSVGAVSGDTVDGSDVFGVVGERVEERVELVENSTDLGMFTRKGFVLSLSQAKSGSARNGFGSGEGVSAVQLTVQKRVRVRAQRRHVVSGSMRFLSVGTDVALNLGDELVPEIVGKGLRGELLTLEQATRRERESAEADENEMSDHSFNL